MTRIHHFDDGVTPPLDLDAIERRRAERSPADNAARQARQDAWQVGRDAYALGEQQLAAGNLERARDAFAIAARHQAPDAADLLHTVTALLDALDSPLITSTTADTALAHTPADPDNEPDMLALRAQDLVHRLDELKARIGQLTADARNAQAAIADARTQVTTILDDTRTPWAPFIRAGLLLLILGAITAGILFTLGPVVAGLGASGTLAAGAGKRYLARRRRNRR